MKRGKEIVNDDDDDNMVLCGENSPKNDKEFDNKHSADPKKNRRKISQVIQATDYWCNEETLLAS